MQVSLRIERDCIFEFGWKLPRPKLHKSNRVGTVTWCPCSTTQYEGNVT
jgi:hypothetical protein